MPKISIVIPIYNVERYLRQCLDSVVNQSFQDIEIICINDASPDNSINILKEYSLNDSRIIIKCLEKNVGLGEARNLGLSFSTGEYVMFLDSDDFLELDACEKALACIEKNSSDITFFNFYKYNENKNSKKFDKSKLRVLKQGVDENGKIDFGKIELPYLLSVEVWYKIYRREFLIENNCVMVGRTFEDSLFTTKCLMLAKNVSMIDEPLYNYRLSNESSITKNFNNYSYFIEARNITLEYVLNKCVDDKFLKSFIVWNLRSWTLFYKKYSKFLPSANKLEFYSEMRKSFLLMNEKTDISILDEYIDLASFNIIVKFESFVIYDIFLRCLFNLFHVEKDIYSNKYSFLFVRFRKKK